MISILTDPLPIGKQFLPELIRKIGRIPRDFFNRPKFNYGFYRGHYAVTRSLIEGLKKAGLPHNYNPTHLRDLSDTVVVLAGVRTLRQAIEFKRKGYIKKLFAGPNIVIFSSDHESLLAFPEVDSVITPSQHIVDVYIEDNPSLFGRCWAWPAGVDVEYWKPRLDIVRQNILIFEKQTHGPVGPIEPYAQYIRQQGYPVEIIRYGSFQHPDYLQSLQRAYLMVGFVAGESQGIAWTEAWSTDVPTLIWRNTYNTVFGRKYRCSTAPYLHPTNGLFFNDLDDFKHQFAYWQNNTTQFSPRSWTTINMSDEVCACNLYQAVTRKTEPHNC